MATIYYTNSASESDSSNIAACTVNVETLRNVDIGTYRKSYDKKQLQVKITHTNGGENWWHKTSVPYILHFVKSLKDEGFLSQADFLAHLKCIKQFLINYEYKKSNSIEDGNKLLEEELEKMNDIKNAGDVLEDIESLLNLPLV